MKLEPCGHLICHACLHNWLDSGRSDCPFCREEIKDSEAVVIDPFGAKEREEEERMRKGISPQPPSGQYTMLGQVHVGGAAANPGPTTSSSSAAPSGVTDDDDLEVGHWG